MTRLARDRATALCVVVLVVASVLLSAAHVHRHPELSPVDELQHIDYLYRAPEIVRDGDKVGQDAMRDQACRTLPVYPSPPCSDTARYDPSDFQESGTNTAAIYTPLYYTITKVAAAPLMLIGGPDSLVTAGRLVGGLWLAAGLVVTFFVARRLGAARAPTTALLLAVAATPNVLLPSATITPDAAGLLAGASMVWAVLWWEENPRRRLWVPALVSLAVVSLKAINILVVVLAALYVVLHYAHQRLWPDVADVEEAADGRSTPDAPSLRWSIAGVAGMSLVGLAGAAGYVLFVQATALDSGADTSMAQTARTGAFPFEGFARHVGVFLQVLYSPGWWVTVPVIGPVVQNVVGLVVFAGTFGAAFLVDGVRRRARVLAVSLLTVGVVGAPLIIAFSYGSTGGYVDLPGRYALTLVPTGVALASATLVRRPARVLVVLAGLGCYVATLGWLLH